MRLENILSYSFKDTKLLNQALTHKSFYNENESGSTGHNERLEFLGDAVLDLSVCHLLMNKFPDLSEGDLSKLRASLVNETSFADLSIELGLQDKLLLGKGELLSGGKDKPRLLASVFEALIGAFYLDAGFERVHEYLENLYQDRINHTNVGDHFSRDYKTRLQEKTQEMFKLTPTYHVIEEEGPDHLKTFIVEVKVDDKIIASGIGKSKKTAEQCAAEKALENLS